VICELRNPCPGRSCHENFSVALGCSRTEAEDKVQARSLDCHTGPHHQRPRTHMSTHKGCSDGEDEYDRRGSAGGDGDGVTRTSWTVGRLATRAHPPVTQCAEEEEELTTRPHPVSETVRRWAGTRCNVSEVGRLRENRPRLRLPLFYLFYFNSILF
jgi:hypothetical protein